MDVHQCITTAVCACVRTCVCARGMEHERQGEGKDGGRPWEAAIEAIAGCPSNGVG